MKNYTCLTMVTAASIMLLMSATAGSSALAPYDSRNESIQLEVKTPIYLAHHFGNRPDGLDDPENVHGGETTQNPNTMEDPNGDDFPEAPDGRPDEIPGN